MLKIIIFIKIDQYSQKQVCLKSLYKFNKMSTIETKAVPRSKLPGFRSTYQLPHTHRLKTPTPKKIQHNLSSLLSPHEKYSNQINIHLQSSKSLLETNLPQIQSKKSTQKRSSILQMWLDQALDPQEKQDKAHGPQLRVGIDKTGPLKTVQKFNIDKKFLKSQNLSTQAIDKIYNSLYIYTHGINNTFEQITALTRANEHLDKKVIDHFWKAFIKLLEGCTSFRTTFQIVEEGHIKTISQIRHSFILKQQEWLDQRRQLDEEKMKLMKKINEQNAIIGKLTTDYNISEATLYLTDQAFNDEVNTRLKFQQKVNQMFGSYDQLRSKYMVLLEQFRLMKQQINSSQKRENQLQQQIQHMDIQIKQYRKQLNRSKEIIAQRDQQIVIKRQQIFQLAEQNRILNQQKDKNEEDVRKLINKMNSYRQTVDQLRVELTSKKILEKQLNKIINQQEEQLSFGREKQQRLYTQLQGQANLVADFQTKMIKNQLQLKNMQDVWNSTNQNAIRLENVNIQLSSQINKLQKDLDIAKGEVLIKNLTIENNAKFLAQLHSINSKAQKMLHSITKQKRLIQAEMNDAISIRERFQEEMTGMKMLLENKAVELTQVQGKLDNERDVFKGKIASLKEQIQFRQKKVLQFHNQMQEGQVIVKQYQKEKTQTMVLNSQLKRNIFNLKAQLSDKISKIQILQKERIQKDDSYKKLQLQLEQIKKYKIRYCQDLQITKGLINNTNKLSQYEAQQLRDILQSYRLDREKKINYIHPMLFEDAIEQISRLTVNKDKLLEQNTRLIVSKQVIQNALVCKTQQYQECLKKYETIKQALRNSQQKLTVSIQKLQQSTKLLADKDNANKLFNDEYGNQIVRLRNQLNDINKRQKQLSQSKIIDTQLILEQKMLIQQYEKTNSILVNNVNQLRSQLKLSQQTIISLQQQNQQFQRNIKSHQILRQKQGLPRNKPQQHNATNDDLIEKSKIMINHKQTQTDKKFSHALKFEVAKTGNDFGCQVENIEQIQDKMNIKNIGSGRQVEIKKVDAEQFKRALKVTYMRR